MGTSKASEDIAGSSPEAGTSVGSSTVLALAAGLQHCCPIEDQKTSTSIAHRGSGWAARGYSHAPCPLSNP